MASKGDKKRAKREATKARTAENMKAKEEQRRKDEVEAYVKKWEGKPYDELIDYIYKAAQYGGYYKSMNGEDVWVYKLDGYFQTFSVPNDVRGILPPMEQESEILQRDGVIRDFFEFVESNNYLTLHYNGRVYAHESAVYKGSIIEQMMSQDDNNTVDITDYQEQVKLICRGVCLDENGFVVGKDEEGHSLDGRKICLVYLETVSNPDKKGYHIRSKKICSYLAGIDDSGKETYRISKENIFINRSRLQQDFLERRLNGYRFAIDTGRTTKKGLPVYDLVDITLNRDNIPNFRIGAISTDDLGRQTLDEQENTEFKEFLKKKLDYYFNKERTNKDLLGGQYLNYWDAGHLHDEGW